ncbi:hypothetical protein STEG23_015380, partial [Scotinomys teguina]
MLENRFFLTMSPPNNKKGEYKLAWKAHDNNSSLYEAEAGLPEHPCTEITGYIR